MDLAIRLQLRPRSHGARVMPDLPATLPDAAQDRRLALERPIDLRRVLGPLVRGSGDPTTRVSATAAIRATNTPAGPAALELRLSPPNGASGEAAGALRATAWGPGGAWLLESLPALLGLDDDETGFDPALHPVVAALARRLGHLPLGRTTNVWEALLPAVLEQRITGTEAWRTYRHLVRAHGSPAPGPLALYVPPTPVQVAALPSWTWPQLGIEPRRGALLRRLAADAARLESLAAPARVTGGGGRGAPELAARLRRYDGVGGWTAAEVTFRALGDPDAVSVGDAHLSHVVGWALAGELRATDERMLELLEPWRGHRARVVRLLELSGMAPPRFGPRVAPRDMRGL